jgi:outer membrane protein assembly factor BamB
MKSALSSVLFAILLIPVPSRGDDPPTADWPAFRGTGNSVTAAPDLPLTWSDTENIAWRSALAGFGQSSPVIFGGRVYITSTEGANKEQLFLQSFDLESGSAKWSKTFSATQRPVEVSEMISRGAPTPAADEVGVYAFFESGDLFALDHDGAIRWERHLTTEFGDFLGGHGIGSSPVITPKHLVLLIDHDGPSYLLCLDKATGKTVWKADREPRVSWTTPLHVVHEGVAQIVVSSNGVAESFALEDGRRLWQHSGIRGNTVASPTRQGGIVVIGSSEPQSSLAIRLGGEGELTASHLAWKAESVTSSFGSPLIHRDAVYFVSRAGVLQANNLADGSSRWERRLPDSCWASPLAAGGLLYFFCKNGHTVVLEPREDGSANELAVNTLSIPEGDRLYGYAVAPGRFVIRTARELIAIGKP